MIPRLTYAAVRTPSMLADAKFRRARPELKGGHPPGPCRKNGASGISAKLSRQHGLTTANHWPASGVPSTFCTGTAAGPTSPA